MLQAGDAVPEFVLPSDTMGDVRASDLRGQRYVIYFYPKDDTTGCTIEACNFRDGLTSFNALNVPVFGISPDNVKSHAKFRMKYGLTFPLLADADHRLAEAFGVWVEKSMYGRKYMGIQRSTFIIGPQGTIERVWEKVTPAEHARDVLAYLNAAPGILASAGGASKPVVEPAAQAAAAMENVIVKTEVTEVETENVNESVPMSAPETVVTTSRKPARKKRPSQTQTVPASEPAVETAEYVVVDTILETPGEPPMEVVEVFAVEPTPAPTASPAVKKTAAKKPAAKKAVAKKAAAKKTTAKKAAAKKTVAKKAAVKKPAAKKSTAKKSAAKKPVAKKSAAAAKKPAAAAKKSAKR